MERPNRDKILKELKDKNHVAYGSYVENEYHKRLEAYTDWMEKQLSIHVVSTRLLADCRNHYLLCTDFETGEPKASMQELLDHWKDVNTQLNIE